ncbi:MAG: response regulator [Myxococcota bacterium]
MSTDAAKTILVVEDAEAVRGLIVEQLSKQGYKTLEVTDGEEALNKLRTHEVDLVCLDLALPLQSGFSVCEAIRADPLLKHLPILVITARTGLQDYSRALELGANRFLEKPFKARDLLAHVKELIVATNAPR